MNPQLPASAAIYNRALLAVYDAYVLGFSNRWVWRCPSARILALYNLHVAGRHLEVGVGTGYFPDHCRFPVAAPAIDLLDIHPDTLTTASRRLSRYRPQAIRANVLEPLPDLAGGYGSIAVNYLLHCLPGPLADKAGRVFAQLASLLDPDDGRLFGATILGEGLPHNALGRRLMDVYNDRGIFGNRQDSESDLRGKLEAHFPAHELEIHSCVAVFVGYRR